jgi:hypothetical protein
VAVFALGTVALPSLARSGFGTEAVSRLQWLRAHYWVGYTIAAFSALHAVLAMTGPLGSSRAYAAGLWIGMGGLALALGQVALGRQLRASRGVARARMRALHVLVLVALVATGGLHIWLEAV